MSPDVNQTGEARGTPGSRCVDPGLGVPRAFTLIELLLVIAVIAVLLGLLLPVMASVRRAARAAACLSNQRQIGAAMNLYANAYRGVVPREGTMGTTAADLRTHLPWNVAFRPFLDDRVSPNVDPNDLFERAPYFRCPGRSGSAHNVHYVANGFAFSAPDKVELRGTNDPRYRRGPMPITLIVRPAQVPYVTELADDPGDALLRVWRQLGDTDLAIGQCYDIWLPRHLDPASNDYRLGPRRHESGSNVLYFDAHAAGQPAAYLSATATYDDGYYSH